MAFSSKISKINLLSYFLQAWCARSSIEWMVDWVHLKIKTYTVEVPLRKRDGKWWLSPDPWLTSCNSSPFKPPVKDQLSSIDLVWLTCRRVSRSIPSLASLSDERWLMSAVLPTSIDFVLLTTSPALSFAWAAAARGNLNHPSANATRLRRWVITV